MRFCYLALLFFSMGFAQEKTFVVYFDTDVSEATIAKGNNVAGFILRNPKAIVTKIEGFCDQSGSDIYNDSLSIKRAKFVTSILQKENYKFSDDFKMDGFGEKFSKRINQQKDRKAVIYYLVSDEKTLPENPQNQLSEEISQLKIGEKMTLPNLYFYNMSGQIVPTSDKTLEDLLIALKSNKKIKIEIQGHICCVVGKDVYDIAMLRARTIYEYLVKNGISKDRLRYKSFANTQPLHPIPEKDEKERDANRRVEIMILANE